MTDTTPATLDRDDWADRFARVALDNVTRDYPYAAHHTTRDATDRALPVELHPAFATSYDWHSSVHMHWLAASLLGFGIDDVLARPLEEVVVDHLSAEKLAIEAAYLRQSAHYERPYGWAWALRLAATVTTSGVPSVHDLAPGFRPLIEAIGENTRRWTTRSAHPVRHGVHGNSAFGLRLLLEASTTLGLDEVAASCAAAARTWFGNDRAWTFDWERSGQDFLSAGLEEADLMRAVLPDEEFRGWAAAFFTDLRPGSPALEPAVVVDESDGQQVHLFGLNLSRAASARRVADALRTGTSTTTGTTTTTPTASEGLVGLVSLLDPVLDPLLEAGLAASVGEEYYSTHWLASFAWDALEARAASVRPA